MRVESAVVLAGVVVLAGCSGYPVIGGGGEATPPVTPVSVDRTSGALPPGVSSDGVANPTALGRAHAGAVENASYVVRSNRTVRGPNGTVRSHLETRVAIDDERRFLATASTAGPEAPVFLGSPPAEGTYWSNGTVYIRRLSRENRTTYVEFEPPGTWIGTWRYWVRSVPFGGRNNRPATFYAEVFSSVPTRLVGRTTVEGTTLFRLEEDLDWTIPGETFPGRVRSIHDVSLVALVDGEGLVRSFDLRYAGTLDGEPVTVNRTIRYTDVGSTAVERPPWYDRAVAVADGSGAGGHDGTDGPGTASARRPRR